MFVALFVVILGLVVWSFAGRIGEDVHGAGIVLGRGTYAGIAATGDGVLVVLDVRPGDEATAALDPATEEKLDLNLLRLQR